ncbi:MAG: ATP-binding protein [Campylobacterota bacterium]|nr:ATP-binding protein [Campylobacterota bacterium]
MAAKIKSLSSKIVFLIAVATLFSILFIFYVVEQINKEAFYNIEMEKAKLVLSTIEPLIAVNLYLNMNDRIDKLTEQLITNPNILSVQVIKDNKLINERKSKEFQNHVKDSFVVENAIFRPNSKKKIGDIILTYSSKNYKELINSYTNLLIEVLFLLVIFFLLFSLYVKKLLYPLRKIAKLLRGYSPDKNIDIPFDNQDNEIGLISYALNNMQQSITKYSKELQKINNQLELKVIEEVEKNKQAQEQVFKSEKLASMGEMIGNIAYQWRQPLSVISTGATGMLIQKEYDNLSDEEFEKTCNLINDNAQYLSQTINDFRDFIRGDSKPVIFNLKSNIDSFIKLVNATSKKHNIKVILDLDEKIEVEGFPNELLQCFINIFNNSKDALIENNPEDERYVFITQKIESSLAIITLQDNAGGIPEDVIDKIFEPYFTTKHQSHGTGLGLHMSYSIIVNHMKGSIEASNTTYNYNDKSYTGAKTTITLPL